MEALVISRSMIHKPSFSLLSIAATSDLFIKIIGSSVTLNGHLPATDSISTLVGATPYTGSLITSSRLV